jgi:DNA replication protein DnaC
MIDDHLENKRKIIFTSNLYINDWIKKVSMVNEISAIRIESRFTESTMVLNIDGKDKRRYK